MNATPTEALTNGEAMYNMLMMQIEPDLVTSSLPVLNDKYKNETPEQSAARAKRYEAAFAEYEKRLSEYLGNLQQKTHEYRRTALQSAEQDEKDKDNQKLHSLEQAFSH